MKKSIKAAIIIIALIAIGIIFWTAMYLSELNSYVSQPNGPGVAVIMPGVNTAKFPYELIVIGILLVAALIVILYEKNKKHKLV